MTKQTINGAMRNYDNWLTKDLENSPMCENCEADECDYDIFSEGCAGDREGEE